MTKPIVITMPCAANAVSRGMPVEADGAGAVKEFDATGKGLGLAVTDKDSLNNVGVAMIGYARSKAAAAAYSAGDKLEFSTSGVQAYGTTNSYAGIAAETKTIATDASMSDTLKVFLNVQI